MLSTLTGAVAVAAAVAAPSAQATGAAYNVLACHDYYRADHEIGSDKNGNYVVDRQCDAPAAQLGITNTGPASRNQGGQFTVTAPTGTSIREVHLDANLRRGSHHLAQIGVWNGSNVEVLANGPDSDPTWQHFDFAGLNHPQLVIRLYCDSQACDGDGAAHVYVRNVHVVLTDNADPQAPSVGGGLVGGGWVRGSATLTTGTSDTGSGVGALIASANGEAVADALGSCDTGGLGGNFSGYLVPCPRLLEMSPSIDSTKAPFHDGSNDLVVAAYDFAGNTSSSSQTVKVDNTPPSLGFANAQDPQDPELIRASASDATSGLAAAKLYMRQAGATEWTPLDTKVSDGQATSRVDSASLPEGDYEFLATATDVAGNATQTTLRADGESMVLAFPLREAIELDAHLAGGSKGQTVAYGSSSKVSGRLLDSAGEPIANKDVLIDEDFGEGALIRHRPTTVTTNSHGRFESKVPAGPTRRITASFDGTAQYGARSTDVGEFTVKSRASLKLADERVPAGGVAVFAGKVGHVGARIPSGGKLLELQVRLRTGRWDTVGEAFRTDEKGRYQRQYRFGKHYTQDAVFRFRVKVLKERNWPYKRGASKQRKLIVRAH
jgi:hypothetical protein